MSYAASMGKGDETRQAILRMALARASQLGLAGISIGKLAQEMRMSKSGVFAHFSAKEQLQLQVLELAADRFVEKVVAPSIRMPRGEPRVRALFDNWLTWANAEFLPGGCIFISTANELDDQPGVLRDFFVTDQRMWLDTLAKAAQIAVDEGHFRSDLDVRQFAYDFYSIALAYHHFNRLIKDPDSERRARLSFDALLQHARA